MDNTKENVVKDKAKTWKSLNRLIIYTIVFFFIILAMFFNLF